MNRLPIKIVVVTTLFLMAVVISPVSGAEKVEPCFDRLPVGWTVTRSFVMSGDETAAIGKRLGVPIKKVSNTFLLVHGRQVQVNILEAKSDDGVVRLHSVISRMKGSPAFCVQKKRQVIEFTGSNVTVALATKISYELGFVCKPSEARYRITADIATIDEADYMSFNKLFNLFIKTNINSINKQTSSQIAELSKRFQFGNQITLRASGQKTQKPVYNFSPVPLKERTSIKSGTVTYSFSETHNLLGMPYVTLTADITTREAGLTPTAREADKILLAATTFWPVDDPKIISLAKKITAGKVNREAKVEAILKWLTPGRNIKFGGPVTGSRWGVKKVLKQKYGHCWDFSDCFVTLCRASDIPCRQVGGWLYGMSGHIWAEVLFEGKGWQQVDPTGGGKLKCGIYHIPYFVTEDGNMPILYVSMPKIKIIDTKR
ncbi:MAG: transglutaminase domain-containing protein [Candidatus Omnitrophica bacterium]|nr:transglutaminase domain-containing protein [Candidatus Omnitrophota bacterium]